MSIDLVSVCKSYTQGNASISVLNGLTASIDEGAVCVICGESGCGKTTLLSIMGAIESIDSGKVSIQGISVHDLSGSEADAFRRNVVSLVFQSHFLLDDFTALENVMLPLILQGVRSRIAKKRATELLERVGLIERIIHKPQELSGGESQRVAVARALITDASVILADEPTGNLDQENAKKVVSLLVRLAKEEKRILVLVTHNREFLTFGTCNYELSQGFLQTIIT